MTQRDSHTPDRGAAGPTDAPAAGLACFREDLEGLAPRPAASSRPAPDGAARPPLLAALLTDQTPDLSPVPASPAATPDPDLDPTQQNALARALNTPDLCLVQGLPGTGKSFLAARLVAHCLARGERVLFLAASAAGVDQVLDHLAVPLRAVRGLGPDEDPERLSPAVRERTMVGRQRFFTEKVLEPARQALRAVTDRLESRDRAAVALDRLEALVDRFTQADAAEAELQRRRAVLPEELAAEAHLSSAEVLESPTPLQSALRALHQRTQAERDRLTERLTALRADEQRLRAELEGIRSEGEGLRPLAEARQTGRWWTGAFWRATFQGQVSNRAEELASQETRLATELGKVETDLADVESARARAETEVTAEASRLIEAERARRWGELDADAGRLAADRATALADWEAGCRDLGPDLPPPAQPTRPAIAACRAILEGLRSADTEAAEQARRQVEAADAVAPELMRRLAGWVDLVALPIAGLARDPLVGDTAPPLTFDRLVLDEADRLTEADFRAAARRTDRWVLFGEPEDAGTHGPRSARSLTLRAAFFQRLWRHLHADPRQLPRAWRRCQGRLCCALRPVPADQERWIQSEFVVDRPEVELRILSVPYQPPELVEVLFPGQTPLPEAKAYLYQELEEPTIQTRAPALEWREEPDRVLALFGPGPGPGALVVELGKGLRETLTPEEPDGNEDRVVCSTTSLVFERAAGWDRVRAEDWVRQRLGLRDLGRTACLTVPHRQQPALAALLSSLLFDGDLPSAGAPFEFVCVPPPQEFAEARRREPVGRGQRGGTATVMARTARAPRGAGFETDLADVRRPDQLPADLRCVLPPHGLVNLLEAQAILRTLEDLLADPAFCNDARAWQRRPSADRKECRALCPGPRRPAVALIALYPAQVALLRRLLAQSLPTCPLDIEVGVPEDFRQRECFAALVSLTRSHSHRAVAFGSSPRSLCLALTRAAGLLLVFGDPGTLARRVQWQGPVEHLDEADAHRERDLVARLLDTVHETRPVPTLEGRPV